MNKLMFKHIFVFLMVLLLPVLVQCASDSTSEDTSPQATTSDSSSITETAPEGAVPPPSYDGKTWVDILDEAKGQTVNWYMWGGSEDINGWVTDYVANNLKERYEVTLNMVPVKDALEFVNKVREEKEAGQDSDGSIDLVWVNGENYRAMREEGLLYGPWSEFLPNTIYVNWGDRSIASDFGYPVEGYESPYGKVQAVIAYDTAKVSEPPTTIKAFIEWIKANPGKFTYSALPDFTGSVFVRHICYDAAGGYEEFQGDFDQATFDKHSPACYQVLNEIEPFLWQEGKTYPESDKDIEKMFATGEIYFNMDYTPTTASDKIAKGEYPDTVRTFIFETGTIANTHYVAIPYNASHKAGAMVLANLLLSPDAQLDKVVDWGSMPAIDPILLPDEWRAKFEALPRGEATLPFGVLAERRLPEPQATWVDAIEEGWIENVLNK